MNRPFVTLFAVAWTVFGMGSPGSAPAHSPRESAARAVPKVVKLPVAFEVANTNRSALSCASDGARYEVKGHLIGPAARLAPDVPGRPRAVTLYLHDFAVGGFFWSFAGVPRYDYAAGMARAGHVSVVIDRLGYGSSGRPDGNDICLGAHADVAHQVIAKLRSGDYVTARRPIPRFDRVALAGHGVGALIANLEALSFRDIDALVAMGYTPQVTQQAFHHFYTNRAVCEAGGEPSVPGGPGRYAFFGQAEADFRASGFHSAPAAVVDVATTLRARDPCGDTASIVGALVRDLKSLPSVKAPVLLVCGREDAVTPDFACPYLKRRYTGSSDVSLFFLRGTGHALPLERTAPTLRRRVATWLRAHGF